MNATPRHRRCRYLGLAAACALPVLAGHARTARADHVSVRVHGHVHVGGGVHVRRVRRVRFRHHYGPHVHLSFGGGLYVRFATPPPPPPPPAPCAYECAAVEPYRPPPPPAPVPTVVTTAPQPEPLRWGLGAFVGSVDPEGQAAGTDLGVLGRFRLSHRFELEAEAAKTSLADDHRVDKRLGAALLFDLSPGSRLSPFVLGGAGFGQTEIEGGTLTARQGYGELGGGLTYRLSRRFHITGDLRAGKRKSSGDAALKAVGPERPLVSEDESYVRGRLGALVYF